LAHVASLLADAGADANLVAGYLHDTIEDQAVTHAELVKAFNADVADLVSHVTDDKNLPKVRRKRLQVEHAPPSAAPRPNAQNGRQDQQPIGVAQQSTSWLVCSTAHRVLRVGTGSGGGLPLSDHMGLSAIFGVIAKVEQ
jgi:(p)ppGpp synthase/HD superfamily hydrolase